MFGRGRESLFLATVFLGCLSKLFQVLVRDDSITAEHIVGGLGVGVEQTKQFFIVARDVDVLAQLRNDGVEGLRVVNAEALDLIRTKGALDETVESAIKAALKELTAQFVSAN
jgi:hypothetical protein